MECIPTSIRVKFLLPLTEHIHTFGTVITATNLPKKHTVSIQNVYGNGISLGVIWRTASENSSFVCLPATLIVR